MILQYIAAATKDATFELMENGRYFATIPACKGVWIDGATIEECRAELPDVLESWILVRLQHRLEIPVIAGFDLNPQPAYAEAD